VRYQAEKKGKKKKGAEPKKRKGSRDPRGPPSLKKKVEDRHRNASQRILGGRGERGGEPTHPNPGGRGGGSERVIHQEQHPIELPWGQGNKKKGTKTS